MLLKSIKYFLVAGVNMAILTTLLALWTDKLELLFNPFVHPYEFLKIIFFTFLSLIAMRIRVNYFRRKEIYDPWRKMKLSFILTCIICSPLYLSYTFKLFQNRLLYANTRKNIYAKLQSPNHPEASNLSFDEYSQIKKMNSFPEIPTSAQNIAVRCYEDVLLPDFLISVQYDVPLEEEIETMNYKSGDYSKTISVEIIGQHKHVDYEEGEH